MNRCQMSAGNVGPETAPRAAGVVYADASSCGATLSAPSAMDGFGVSGDVRTPSLRAISTMFFGPTSSESRAYTVLSDWMVAVASDSTPAYVCSYVCTF